LIPGKKKKEEKRNWTAGELCASRTANIPNHEIKRSCCKGGKKNHDHGEFHRTQEPVLLQGGGKGKGRYYLCAKKRGKKGDRTASPQP